MIRIYSARGDAFAQRDGPAERDYDIRMEIDESKVDYTYVPEHLKERVKNWRSLSFQERMELTFELSVAAWEKLGVLYDRSKPMDKTIRRVERSKA